MRHLRVHSCVIIIAFLWAVCPAHAQTHKKYFEYNNPLAIKLSKKTLGLVTSTKWTLSRWDFVMRGDTSGFQRYSGHGSHVFRTDKTFTWFRTSGTWAVHRKKYIVCKPDTSGRNPNIPDFILSVIALTDNSMVLQKLHTSSRDMFRTYYFSTKPEQNAREGMAGGAITYFPSNQRSMKFRDMQTLDSVTIDSLSFQYKELLVQDKFDVSDSGVLEIKTRDSTYQIHLRSRAGEEGRRVFSSDERVGFPNNVKRFTPGDKEVLLAESALKTCVIDNLHESGYEGDFTLDDQFRQFAGYFNAGGQRMIRITAFVSYHRDWRTELVDPEKYKGALLIASINLKTGRCQDLIIR